MVYFNLGHAVECMKTIVDSHKCVACDKLDGPFVRYPCGHSTCRGCVETAEDCLLCLTPPQTSTHFVDGPLSCRTEHVSKLLLAFQDLFKINVYRQVRLSEQQKLENQVFPTGIQASSKYCNRRKTLNISIADKENIIPFLPGENISHSYSKKMESTVENVQRWLRNNDTNLKESTNLPRKPFADLNVNRLSLSKTKTLGGLKNNKVTNKKHTQRRKQPEKKKLQLIKQECQAPTNTSIIKRKNKMYKSDNLKEDVIVIEESQIDNIHNKNFIDEEVIEIDDSQKDHIDKDKLAWLSVLREAEKNQSYVTIKSQTETNNLSLNSKDKCSTPIKALSLDSYKVPFYKRGVLYETCNLCKKDLIVKGTKSTKMNNSNNVTVNVDSDVYEAIIKITDCVNDFKVTSKESVAVQTDIINCNDHIHPNPQQCAKTTEKSHVSPSLLHNVVNSIDLFEPDTDNNIDNVYKTNQEVNVKNLSRSVIVEESETESESGNENGKILEVVAEIHRSEPYIDRRVLSTLEPKQYHNRNRKPVRGRTPLSTDSSDKENYDPNRAKRRRLSKKCIKKK